MGPQTEGVLYAALHFITNLLPLGLAWIGLIWITLVVLYLLFEHPWND